ncbi:interleukin-6 receptor subunit beta isoform X2 [Etheostoma spectabile]|uniref:interleukin-6 receptor subunit beta isoform X2 n=1 Tax=Etheostoma spectabile TaxID=54343 RepID=UPI0013AF24FE|nr:interleukin-6 receptor subunit beta-like isoform X2 [Etheostoma spectabile]
MNIWSSKLHLATWTVMSFLCVFSEEVMVRDSDLKLCEKDKRVCVTDLRDCAPRPPASIQKTLSCCYQISQSSITCEWSQELNSYTEPDVSLIFSSEDTIISCQGIFNPAAVLNVTARIKNYMMGREVWSQPHTVFLYDAVKPSQPVLTVLGSTEDSIDVSWRSNVGNGSCRLCYRVDNTHTWTQVPGYVPAHRDQTLTYTIRDLLSFTVYRAAVACREDSGIWSDWSSDVSTRTLDRVPSGPPEVCYRVETTDSGGSFVLHLMWKDLDLRDAGGRILGYQVSYEPVKKQQLQDRIILNVTDVTALLVVEEGNCSVTVTAFNTAGCGPAAHLSIDPQTRNTLPSVRSLWVSSSFPAMKGLLVQWENPTASPSVPPVSHLAVQWRDETRPSTIRWTTEDNKTTSTVIQALMEPVQLKVGAVTKTTVTVVWVWQRKAGPIRVNRYRVMLTKESESETLSLWPDQWQLTFNNLEPNTEYSLLLLADDVSRNIIPVRTDFDEMPAVATATPLLLLAVIVFIISILSRTVYKSYFFPPISSPQGSKTGRWLMDPNHPKTAERSLLDIEAFQVTDILGQKSPITICPNSQPSSEEDLREDTSLLSISHLIIKQSSLELNPDYISDAPVITEDPLVFLQSYHADYTVSCQHPDTVFPYEDSCVADTALLHQTHEGNSYFPQKEEKSYFSEKEIVLKCNFCEFMPNSHCAYQMACEAEYVSSFLGKTDV